MGKFAHVCALEGQEPELYVGVCGVACKGVIGSHYTVAGDNYGDGVVSYCTAYGLGGHSGDIVFGCDRFGYCAVGGCLSIGDIA